MIRPSLILIFGIITLIGSRAWAADPFAGTWSGTLEVNAAVRLPLVLRITQDADGTVAGSLDSPSQNAFGIVADEVLIKDGTIWVSWAALGAIYEAEVQRVDGEDALVGTFTQLGNALPLTLTRGELGAVQEVDLVRPQTPEPPFPYTEEEVSIPVPGTEVVLAGTLTLPDTLTDTTPLVVMLTGSGPQDRDETLAGTGHSPFLVIADLLARQGIAVLRTDDRGTADSTGDYDSATIDDFALDAAAALTFAGTRHEGPLGFFGHSEGGITAIRAVAIAEAKPDFIVSFAGPFKSLGDVLITQTYDITLASGGGTVGAAMARVAQANIVKTIQTAPDPESACEALTPFIADVPEQARGSFKRLCGPWGYHALPLDPSVDYATFDGPVLALFGGRDTQVSATESAPVAEEVLSHPASQVVVVPGVNHLFQPAETGALTEYGNIELTVSPGVVDGVATWVKGLPTHDR